MIGGVSSPAKLDGIQQLFRLTHLISDHTSSPYTSETSSRREWDINLVLKTLENVQLSHLTPDTPGEETISFTPIMSLVKP